MKAETRPAPDRRRAAALIASVVLLVAAIAFAFLRTFRDSTEPVAVDDAVSLYRAQTPPPTDGRASATARLPEPGVYVYRTTGAESLRDAPLGDSRHGYPRRTGVLVRHDGCGFAEQWVPLERRARELTLCRTRRGLTLVGARETRAFFSLDSPREIDCPGGLLLAPRRADGAPWTSTCSISGISSATQTIRSRLAGRETLTVLGTRVAAFHLREELRFSGEIRGRATRDSWRRAADGLLLREAYREQSVVSSHVGDLRLLDAYGLELVSLEPRR